MENSLNKIATSKDYKLALLAGTLIGLLMMPILKTAKSDLYEILRFAIIPFFMVATPVGLKIASLIGEKIAIVWQISKFGLIGVLNTLVDIGVLAFLNVFLFKYFGVEQEHVLLKMDLKITALIITVYTIYKSISFIIANINSYYWNKYWTFEKKVGEKTKSEFVQFFVVSLIGFLINVTVASYVFGSIDSFASLNSDQWGLIGAATGSIAGLIWNFLGYKFWVFKK